MKVQGLEDITDGTITDAQYSSHQSIKRRESMQAVQVLKEMMAENFLNLKQDINLQIQGTE